MHYTDALGSGMIRGFVEFMAPSFIQMWHPDIYENKTLLADLATMHCTTMKGLMRQLALKHIDIWVLDVEGAEESVLRGTDFNTLHVSTIIMECDRHDLEKNKAKLNILEENNFQCTILLRNCFCHHESFVASSKPDNLFDGQKRWVGNQWTGKGQD